MKARLLLALSILIVGCGKSDPPAPAPGSPARPIGSVELGDLSGMPLADFVAATVPRLAAQKPAKADSVAWQRALDEKWEIDCYITCLLKRK